MTFIELVNAVLVNLREEEVSTVTATPYVKLIARFVNAAKHEVEGTWRWHDLRSEFPFTATPGQKSYSVASNHQVLGVFTADDRPLKYRRTATAVELYPTPQTAFAFKVKVYTPQARLAAGTDVLLCPAEPVIELATAKAFGEKGEDSASTLTGAMLILGNAAAVDMNRDPDEITWSAD